MAVKFSQTKVFTSGSFKIESLADGGMILHITQVRSKSELKTLIELLEVAWRNINGDE